MTLLDEWIKAACAELGLDPADVPGGACSTWRGTWRTRCCARARR